MSYKRTNWINEVTMLNAKNLNNIEDGVSESLEGIKKLSQNKQNKLTAGNNIVINNNVISATGGSGESGVGPIQKVNSLENPNENSPTLVIYQDEIYYLKEEEDA